MADTESVKQIEIEEVTEINKTNFHEYFFDVRRHPPKAGQIMAKFSAVAIFGAGREKRDMIKILKMDKGRESSMVMRKLHLAKEPDCYRVPRDMCLDLMGMSDEEVENKDYEFTLEAFYYTKKECVPKGDPHWETIKLLKFDPETNTFSMNMEI